MDARCVFAVGLVSLLPVQQNVEKRMMIGARAGRVARSTVTRLELEILEDYYRMPT